VDAARESPHSCSSCGATMTLSQILFGFTGRLARLQYFGYTLLSIL
jgi:hypothetical protein